MLHADQRSDNNKGKDRLDRRPLHCVPHDPERDGGKRCASPPSMFSGEKERRKARQERRNCVIEKFEQNLPAFVKIHQFYKKIFLYVFYLLSFVFEFNSLVFQRFC